MPFYSSVSARNESQRVEKRDRHLGEVMGEAMNGDHDDHEVVPHDREGNPLDPKTRKPIETDDTSEVDDDYDGDVVGDFENDDETSSVEKSRHAFGDAVQVAGHGHGSVPRAQLYAPRRPQPADAGSLSTPRSGALASSVGGNPGNVTLQSLDYRVGNVPGVSFPNTQLAQPAPHTAPNTANGGSR